MNFSLEEVEERVALVEVKVSVLELKDDPTPVQKEEESVFEVEFAER